MVIETSTDKQAHPRDGREPLDDVDTPANELSRTSSQDEQVKYDMCQDIEKEAGDNQVAQHDIEKNAPAIPASPPVQQADPNLVVFDGPDDPGNPLNWSIKRKVAITASMGSMTFVVTFSSSIFATCLGSVVEEFHISEVVATLGVALFLLVSTA
jgi:MFS transporter, DHA1 family, multidrug resistance protein